MELRKHSFVCVGNKLRILHLMHVQLDRYLASSNPTCLLFFLIVVHVGKDIQLKVLANSKLVMKVNDVLRLWINSDHSFALLSLDWSIKLIIFEKVVLALSACPVFYLLVSFVPIFAVMRRYTNSICTLRRIAFIPCLTKSHIQDWMQESDNEKDFCHDHSNSD